MTDDLERRLRDWMAEDGDLPPGQASRVAAAVSTLPSRGGSRSSAVAFATMMVLIVAVGALVAWPDGGPLGGAASPDPGQTRGRRLAPTPVVRPSPPDPAAFSGDPRLARCTSGDISVVEFAFEMRRASDYRQYLPAMLLAPELDVPEPALVAVYRADALLLVGGGAAPLPGRTWPPRSLAPDGRDVCIVVGTEQFSVYQNVDIAGMQATLSGEIAGSPPSSASSTAEESQVSGTVATSSPAPGITEAPTEPAPTASPTFVQEDLHGIARSRVRAGAGTCMAEAAGSRRLYTAAELDGLIDLAGGVDRFISGDWMWAGGLDDATGAFGGQELLGFDGNEAWILIPDRNGDPSALGLVRLQASSAEVWVSAGRIYRCSGAPTSVPPQRQGRLDPTCLPVGAECGPGINTVVPGLYVRNGSGERLLLAVRGDVSATFGVLPGAGRLMTSAGRLMTMDRVWDAGGEVSIEVFNDACRSVGRLEQRLFVPGADAVLMVDVSPRAMVRGLAVEDLGAGPVGDGQLLEVAGCTPGGGRLKLHGSIS